MPTYVYRCAFCGRTLEIEQGIKDRPRKKCPKCGRMGLKRVPQKIGFVLKGAGFYRTEYGSGYPKEGQDGTRT